MPRPSTTRTARSLASAAQAPGPRLRAEGPSKPLALASLLIAWQKRSGRHDLPWQVRDPYRVWLSEIMLQQTQVATVIPYYLRFLERFPQLEALAQAQEESVLEAWSGLGYYSRARNLHRCAQEIVELHGGSFPHSLELLQTLPGIGRSTAAAISVFCFSKTEAILDGNVKRVLSRVFSIAGVTTQSSTEKELWQIALGQLPTQDIESYTQGLMDLGSSLCTPRQTRCAECPLSTICLSSQLGLTHILPSPKARKITPRREQTFALIFAGNQVLLERQASPGIWGGLLSFPKLEALKSVQEGFGALKLDARELAGFDHAFTHFKLHAKVKLFRIEHSAAESKAMYETRIDSGIDSQAKTLAAANANGLALPLGYRLLSKDKIAEAALPQPIKAYLLQQAIQYFDETR